MAETYDLAGARKAGLSDADIASALADRTNYDLAAARKANVPDAEIVNALVTKFNQGFPDTTTKRPPGLSPGKSMIERANQFKEQAINSIMMRDPGVDYSTGIKDFGLRAGFSRMSNDAERQNYLDKTVGAGNFGVDKFGRYYINPQGLAKVGIQSDKPMALDESGLTKYDLADVAGSAPAVAGAIGGSLMASGAGFLPGVGATALGAAGGAAIDEIIKNLQGYNLKSPAQEAAYLAKEGGAAALGEGAGRTIIGAGRLAMNPYGVVADPARQALTREAVDQGFVPKVFQFQPRGSLLARFQSMGENVLGDQAASKNAAAMQAGISKLQSKAGAPLENTGQTLIDKVSGYASNLTDEISSAKNTASKFLSDSLSSIQRTLGSSDPNVGSIVQGQIKAARSKFGQDASALYGKVDQITGGKPIIPTSAVKQQLNDLMQNLPTDSAGNKIFPTPELKQFFSKYGNIADHQTTSQMQQLRTDFSNASDSLNLVPGMDKYRARLMKQSVDKAFEDAMQGGAENIQALNALKEADQFYKTGIRKFDAPTISAITRDASKTGSVEPDRVVDTIIRPGYTASAERVKGLVSPDVWGKVQRTHFDSLLADSTRLINGVDSVNGSTLLNKINGMGKTFDIVYGNKAPAIKQYVSELAASGGKLDPALLQGDIAANLQKAALKQKELDTFLSKNYLAGLAKPGQEATQAADFIFRPNSPQRIATAKRFYGENSPEFQGLQNEAMNKILSDLVQTGEDPLKKIFDGKALVSTLDKYGKQTLEQMFGKQTTGDLYNFARTAQFVTQKNPNSGGIVAAAVALHPLRNVWKIVDLAGTGYLLRQPGAIKWLSEGIQPGNKAAAAGAIAKLGSLASALVRDKTSAGNIDLSRPDYQQQKQ